jgi:uncharacterized repeat protein (TIGR01451 family)
MELRVLLATFTVQSAADDGSAGTLRWAVNQVNSDSGPDTIQFNLPGPGVQVIALSSPLPQITTAVTIDGTSQPGYSGSPLIQIDGTHAGSSSAGLLISCGGSTVEGLVITGFSGPAIELATGGGNLVLGNELGTNPAGMAAAPNGEGIKILGSWGNSIGGTSAGQGNLISGNLGAGIEIANSAQASSANVLQGNFIGTTASGMKGLPNQGSGILVNGATSNVIGGSASGAGNVVSCNLGCGVQLISGATKNTLVGNLIGTTADGKSVLPNQTDGVLLDGAPGNVIGGEDPGDGNIISGNLGNGVNAVHQATSNLIEGNDVGTDLTGTLSLGNRANGICLGASHNSVGSLNSGGGNTIAYNGTGSVGAGVQLVGLVDQDTIVSNSIHDNAGLGINLGNGPTPNHQPGSGPGPNDFQNYPILSAPVSNGQSTTLSGTLLGQPSSAYTVQVFWSPQADPSGFGEGQHLLSTFTVSTDSHGNASFSPSLPSSPPGAVLSATATDSAGNTSEFSPDVQIQGVTDIAVTLVATPSPVGAGGTLTYVATVTNVGSLDANNVVLSDQLPGNVMVESARSSQGSPPMPIGRTVSAKLGTVPVHGTATLTIVVSVQSAPGTTLSDSASATLQETDPTPGDNSATVTTPVVGVADLSVAITASPSTIHHGDSLTYTIAAQNLGPGQATGVTITLPLASGLGFASATSSQGTASFRSGQVTASLGTLASGAGATVTVVVGGEAPGQFTSTATISSVNYDPVSSNNSASVTVTVLPVIDLGVAIAANPSPVATGQTLVYTLNATNQGPDAASAVTVSDVLPSGVTFVSASSSAGSAPTISAGTVTALLGALSPGASATVVITVVPTVSPGATLLDSATISSPEFDSNTSNNSASLLVPVRPVSNLAVTMTPSGSSVPIGQTIGYSMVVANAGPVDEPDAVLSLPLPPVVNLVSCSSSQGTPVVTKSLVSIDLGAIAKGNSATITMLISPQSGALGSLTMTASASAYNANLDPAQTHASATVTVAPAAELSVSLGLPKTPVYQDVNATYTITVSNAGPSPATNVSVASPLPAGATFVSAADSQGSAPVFQAGQLAALLGTLAAGHSATVSVVLTAPLPVPSGLTISASATAEPFDPNLTDNSASATMAILPSDDLAVSLVSASQTGQMGKNLTLTATVVNSGPSSDSAVVLSLPLIGGALFVGATPGMIATSVQGGVLTAQLGPLGVGAQSTISITVQPQTAGPTNWSVSVTGSTHDLNPANNQAAALVNVAASPGILQFASDSELVNETAGFAAVTVVRTLGTGGTVTVHYQTGNGIATPGVDYTPVSGILTFAPGQASQTILVPVLDNPYDNHDEYVGLYLDSPTGGAVLGSLTANLLLIHDTDPDVTPPQVTKVTWSSSGSLITSLVVSFSEPIPTSLALNPVAYAMSDLGTSTLAAATVTRAIGLLPATYNPTTWSVTLLPMAVLPTSHFYRIQVNGSGVAPIRDQAGNLLAGAAPNLAGTNFVSLIGQGTTIKYTDSTGDLVTLKVTGGGYLDLTRSANGEGLVLSLQNGVAHKTTISGTVARVKGKGAGVTTLQTIEGLGQFGDIKVTLTSPPFMVRVYPFFLRTGKGAAKKAAVRLSPNTPKLSARLAPAIPKAPASKR